MPHLKAVARRGRVIASLVGVLALVVALFGTVATAGAGTTTTPPTYNHCPPGQTPDKYGHCVPATPPCKPGTHEDQYGKCVPDTPPCAPGEHPDRNGNCAPDTPPCAAGEHPDNNGQCVPATPPCANGEQPGPNGDCVPATPPCAAGQGPDQNGVCVTPPATPATPAGGTAPATTPAAGTVPATTTTAQRPAGQVEATQARSATARLSAQTRCATRTVRITIRGNQIRRVTFRVAGRVVRTVTVRAGQRTVSVNLPVRRFGARRQAVQARVTFRNGAAARTLNASATRCAQGAVSPQFTG